MDRQLQFYSSRPTDNFIVAVKEWKQRVKIDVAAPSNGIVPIVQESIGGDRLSAPVPLSDKRRTKLVSIGRTLHAELDRMATPTDEDWTTGYSQTRFAAGTVTIVEGAPKAIDVSAPISKDDRFQFIGGKITLLNSADGVLGTFDIVGQEFFDATSVTTLTLSNPIPAGAAKFRNLQDDDLNQVTTSADMAIDTSLWAAELKKAMIRLDVSGSSLGSDAVASAHTSDVPFRSHIGSIVTPPDGQPADAMDANFIETTSTYRVSQRSNRFWTTYMLGAFQGRRDHDLDHVIGVAGGAVEVRELGFNLAPAGSVIFLEQTREWFNVRDMARSTIASVQQLLQIASLHELGHSFTLSHSADNGAIMDPNAILSALNPTDPKAIAAGFAVPVAFTEFVFSGKALREMVIFGPRW